MKSAFLVTIALAALALARPVTDDDSVSAVSPDATAEVDSTAVSTTSVDDEAASTTSLAVDSLAESSPSAWIDLSYVSGVTSGSLTKFMGITYATAKSVTFMST